MVMKATCWTVKVVELVYTTVEFMNQLELSAKVSNKCKNLNGVPLSIGSKLELHVLFRAFVFANTPYTYAFLSAYACYCVYTCIISYSIPYSGKIYAGAYFHGVTSGVSSRNFHVFNFMDVGMHHAKNSGNKEIPLAILSRILVQSYVTLPTLFRQRVTHDCASILDSIAKGISLFPRFFAWCIPTSIFIRFLHL